MDKNKKNESKKSKEKPEKLKKATGNKERILTMGGWKKKKREERQK